MKIGYFLLLMSFIYDVFNLVFYDMKWLLKNDGGILVMYIFN